MTKSLVGNSSVYEGDTILFLLNIVNRSNENIGYTPVIDTFDADKLEFLYAIPEPDSALTGASSPYSNTGSLFWSDIGFITANSDSFDAPVPLVGHWAMEQGSGTTVTDSSSSSLNASLSGGNWISGPQGSYALDFDGNNDFVSTPNANLGLGTSFAFGLWANF